MSGRLPSACVPTAFPCSGFLSWQPNLFFCLSQLQPPPNRFQYGDIGRLALGAFAPKSRHPGPSSTWTNRIRVLPNIQDELCPQILIDGFPKRALVAWFGTLSPCSPYTPRPVCTQLVSRQDRSHTVAVPKQAQHHQQAIAAPPRPSSARIRISLELSGSHCISLAALGLPDLEEVIGHW